MKKSHIIIALVAFVCIVFISAKSFENEKPEYEYLSINYTFGKIHISSVTEGYKEIKDLQDIKGMYNINPVLQLIETYENSGYELFEFTTCSVGSTGMSMVVLMRKSK